MTLPYRPTKPGRPRVIIHQLEDGSLHVFFEAGADVYWVDERYPHDRVFKMSTQVPSEEIDRVLGDDPVGCVGDEAQKRTEVRMHHLREGLKLVEGNDEA